MAGPTCVCGTTPADEIACRQPTNLQMQHFPLRHQCGRSRVRTCTLLKRKASWDFCRASFAGETGQHRRFRNRPEDTRARSGTAL